MRARAISRRAPENVHRRNRPRPGAWIPGPSRRSAPAPLPAGSGAGIDGGAPPGPPSPQVSGVHAGHIRWVGRGEDPAARCWNAKSVPVRRRPAPAQVLPSRPARTRCRADTRRGAGLSAPAPGPARPLCPAEGPRPGRGGRRTVRGEGAVPAARATGRRRERARAARIPRRSGPDPTRRSPECGPRPHRGERARAPGSGPSPTRAARRTGLPGRPRPRHAPRRGRTHVLLGPPAQGTREAVRAAGASARAPRRVRGAARNGVTP